MENFVFYAPTYFAFGDGEEKKTGELVRHFGGTKVLLVTGGGSARRSGAYDSVAASLEKAYQVLSAALNASRDKIASINSSYPLPEDLD